jgi:hypothetical protein
MVLLRLCEGRKSKPIYQAPPQWAVKMRTPGLGRQIMDRGLGTDYNILGVIYPSARGVREMYSILSSIEKHCFLLSYCNISQVKAG